jgi:ATP-dependent DNA helicase RecG
LPIAGRTILVLEVASYPAPPVVEHNGHAYVRIGTTTRRATHADLARLNERRPENRQPFDTRPMPSATEHDLDLVGAKRDYEELRNVDAHIDSFPAFEAWLAQRQLGSMKSGRFTPNAAAILILGKSPQDLIPAAKIDLVRYAGTDRDARVVSRRPATGTLRDQLEVGWNWIALQTGEVPEGPSGIRSGFVPDYPVEALKELLRNLVQHRIYEGTHAPGRVEWFDDRIEFSNPGGPFGRAAEGTFGTHSDYRNPLITKLLTDSGHVQQLGRGVQRTRIQLEKNGNPALEAETDGFTRLIVRSRR